MGLDGAVAGLLRAGALVRGVARFPCVAFGFGGFCPASAPPVRALLAYACTPEFGKALG